MDPYMFVSVFHFLTMEPCIVCVALNRPCPYCLAGLCPACVLAMCVYNSVCIHHYLGPEQNGLPETAGARDTRIDGVRHAVAEARELARGMDSLGADPARRWRATTAEEDAATDAAFAAPPTGGWA